MATIQGVYVALFGRPADPTGLAYFNGVTKNGADLSGIGDLASTQEYKDRFAGQSNLQIVTSIYQSLFNRDPEAAGLNFFTDALNKGTLSIKNIAIAILDGAQGTDKTIVTNKITAADNFTKALDTPIEVAAYTGNAAAAQGRAFLTPVNAATSSIPSAAATDAAILTLTSVATGGVTLTVDNTTTLQGDVSPTATDSKLKTTGGDDTINVIKPSATQKIDGGLGVDTLSYKTIAGTSGAAVATVETVTFTPAADTVTNVEKLVLGGTVTVNTPGAGNTNGNFVVDLANVKGLTSITDDALVSTGYTGFKVANIASSVVDLAVNGKVAGVEFAYGADVAASNTLTLKAATDVAGTGASNVTITNGADSLKLVTSGNSLVNLTDAAAKTITVSGSGTLGFTDNAGSTALTKFDASALSGKLTADFSAATKGIAVTGTNNADAITLSTIAVKDTVVYQKGELSSKALSEIVNNFHATSGGAVEDKIDLKAFAFTNTALTTFTSAPTDGAALATGSSVGFFGGDLYIDSNGNGKVDITTDIVVHLNSDAGVTAVTGLTADNIVWS